ncbi:MAG: hypothetical protein HQL31_08155, partial [Planctomycetes bacterium]|nr:hypothetical protein [Planctomycetota bacterium]
DNHHQLDFSKQDFVGFRLGVVDLDPKKRATTFDSHSTQFPPDMYPNGHMILDLQDQLPGDAVINAHMFPPAGTYRH